MHRIISIKTVNFKTDINVGGWQNCQCPWHASHGTRPAAEADRQFAKRAVGTMGAGGSDPPQKKIMYEMKVKPVLLNYIILLFVSVSSVVEF